MADKTLKELRAEREELCRSKHDAANGLVKSINEGDSSRAALYVAECNRLDNAILLLDTQILIKEAERA